MARDAEMERRLRNWARWCAGVSGSTLGYAAMRYTDEPAGTAERDIKIPVLGVEAEETDRAVRALEAGLQLTLKVVYVWEYDTKRQQRELGCTARAIQLRVERAHWQLKDWLDVERQKRDDLRRLNMLRVNGARP